MAARWAIFAIAIAAVLPGCVTGGTGAAPAPVNATAPFPLAGSRIVGHPSPGAILVETSTPRGLVPNVRGAARDWCGGPAQVSRVSSDVSTLGVNRQTWVIRCQ